MAFPFLDKVLVPDWKKECDAEFFEALRQYDIEAVLAFEDAHSHDLNYITSMMDDNGNSPLHIVLSSSSSEYSVLSDNQGFIVKRLLSLGFDVNKVNHDGVSVKQLAAKASIDIQLLFSRSDLIEQGWVILPHLK